jgi:hypothetical protein
MILKKLAMSAAIAVLLSACATPHVVQAVRPADTALSCNQLEQEMTEAERFRENAQKEKGMTGTNVAAALFFWPAMFGTYANANEAIAAADTRKSHLAGLHAQKRCGDRAQATDGAPPVGMKTDKKLEELKAMFDKGLITKEEYDSKRAQLINAI